MHYSECKKTLRDSVRDFNECPTLLQRGELMEDFLFFCLDHRKERKALSLLVAAAFFFFFFPLASTSVQSEPNSDRASSHVCVCV